MDRSIKARGGQSTEACTLYCFPEISCGKGKETGEELTGGHFVGDTTGPSGGFSVPEDKSKEKDPIDEQIQAAYNDGMTQGRAEMMAAYQESVDQATHAFESAIAELVRVRERDVGEMETETVRLALAIAKKIVGVQAGKGSVIQHVVKAAMQKVGDPRHLTLKMNPEDISAVESIKQKMLIGDDPDAVCRIESDETIERGGCMIETQLGDVDARIDQQIQALEDLLTDQLSDSPGEG